MSVQIYSGLPGSSKTYNATQYAVKEMKKGRPVFSTYPIRTFVKVKGKRKEIVSFQLTRDMLSTYNFPKYSLLIVDEAMRWFNSRNWKNMKMEEMTFFTEHRHLSLELIIIQTNIARVDVSVREVVELFWWCTNMLGSVNHKWADYSPLFKITGYFFEEDFVNLEVKNDKYRPVTRWVFKSKKICESYDTKGNTAMYTDRLTVPLTKHPIDPAKFKYRSVLEKVKDKKNHYTLDMYLECEEIEEKSKIHRTD